MGFFSWKTQDTDRSIPNVFSNRTTFKVVMVDDKGNKYVEENYEGYGEFGGKETVGIETFRLMYEKMGFKRSVAFSKLPIIRQLFNGGYWIFAHLIRPNLPKKK